MEIPTLMRFYFEAGGRKYKSFRGGRWYKAIFMSLEDKSSSLDVPVITLDITTFIKKHFPDLYKRVRENDRILGKTVGSCLKNLKWWNILKSEELQEMGIRQKQFKINDAYKDYLLKHIKKTFLQ